MRILQAANFVGPTSGGLRVALAALARGYLAAGHEVVQLVPGPGHGRAGGDVRAVHLPTHRVPGLGGYRVMASGRRLQRVLADVRPDRIEVSDRTTLLALGPWGRDHGVPAAALVHERLDALLGMALPRMVATRLADAWNRRLVDGFDTVVCSTAWGRAEFDRIDAPSVAEVPLGVDLQLFHPARRSPALRRALAPGGEPLLVLCSRLSREKAPELAIEAVRTLGRRGTRVRLVVAGAGPLADRCRAAAADLPVTFLGFVADRTALASLLATADVVLSPAPAETFGLAALEALASGTPVVGRRRGAVPEVLGSSGGRVAYGHPAAFASAVTDLLDVGVAQRRAAARARARAFDWSRTVERMLAVHDLPVLQAA